MKVLKCECGEVMQKVEYATAQTTTVGINQLAKHMAEVHVLPTLEEYLKAADRVKTEHRMSLDDMIEATIVRCWTCKKQMTEDSYRYKRVGIRTVAFCSDKCLNA